MKDKSPEIQKSKFSKGQIIRCCLKTLTADYSVCTVEHCGQYLLVEYFRDGKTEVDKVPIEKVRYCRKLE